MSSSLQYPEYQRSLLRSSACPLEDLSAENQPNTTRALGKPSTKQLFSYADLTALIVSLLCLVLAYLVISPSLSFAWQLQYSGQIVVIGALLSIMNFCMRTLASYAFLLLEVRFGQSRLQNYEAILTGRVIGSHTSYIWRLVIVILTILPIGLSIAYKRFLFGEATNSISFDGHRQYGIDLPRVSDFAPVTDPIYLLSTSINPFQAAWTDQLYPASQEFPTSYGYNTLLLSDSSAAILDMPRYDYVKEIQNYMEVGEAWNLSATVNAYKATYNSSTLALRKDNTYWDQAINSSYGLHDYVLVDIYMWINYTRIGAMDFGNGNQMFFSLYNGTTDDSGDISYSYDRTDTSMVLFQAAANLYDIRRVKCYGNWYVNKTSINLSGGHCNFSDQVNQSIVENEGRYWGFYPYHMDFLPIFSHLFRAASTTYDWPWLNATYAFSVATIYWARALYMLRQNEWSADSDSSVWYAPDTESILSSRITLNATGLLYLVLAIQPLLTVVAFIVSLLLQNAPIGRAFGVTAILSGFDASSSPLIRGAGLSGELKAPIRLEINPDLPDSAIAPFENTSNYDARIRYRLTSGLRPTSRPKLERDRLYY